ncbi:OLC1v1013495C1 [Oldenlandia corymbosa var. corymbosa]|uniref:Protein ECERIFERUM 7 n=1 Tax=Oldenlandia corymbosa var. corymbosa TaxID=529605 RepID=A0AAV1E1X1_OLDCO|nr:OLC1v1013495C1 [Oldenlandia corymbosa var. corymbosa]
MEQRLANTFRMTLNEKKFIEAALAVEEAPIRIDGRRPFEYRELTIKFGREDGTCEVQLGQTHVMAFVTSQLVQPYRDRPNEGSLSIFTEFSPMADPSFEAGRPGESAVELGRVVDRGLRESRAVDTESLCVVSGKFVWSIRIDLHILDNGGNLVDAANIAALAALSTFRRPECSLGGDDGQEVIIHSPEVREPLPLIIHHLPIAVTFGFIGEKCMLLIDPTYLEEGVMRGRLTATLNANGDICAIQKAGGDGVEPNEIIRCIRIAEGNAKRFTDKIKEAVALYDTERALRKIKRQPSTVAVSVGEPSQKEVKDVSMADGEKLLPKQEEKSVSRDDDMEIEPRPEQDVAERRQSRLNSFVGGPSSWDPVSKGVDFDGLQASLASRGDGMAVAKLEKSMKEKSAERQTTDIAPVRRASHSLDQAAGTGQQGNGEKTLKDAVKPKHKRKKKVASKSVAN